ncbi:MAG: helix-turn-helix domain-containing protein [Ruminococcaceae bacterium]|nr:helix-turn-helix domain-containing protein [Oscillospiraceae bacterium]
MKIAEINPHIRFAEQITYSILNRTVYVRDCRLIYILDGAGELNINNNSYKLEKNTLFYCPWGTTYNIIPKGNLVLYVINFDFTQNFSDIVTPLSMELDENDSEALEKTMIDDSNLLNCFMVLKDASDFKNQIGDMISEYTAKRLYYKETASTILKSLIIKLHRKNTGIPENSQDKINNVIDFINSNYTNEITNSDLSEIAGYHEYYLNRIFIRQTGISMHKFILQKRTNEGKRLLLNTNLSISEIASKTGFNNATYFSSYFKKELGMSPFEFRKTFKNNP